ncbi:FAD-binding oxidoreductase [Biomaibacter acetigenes]|uniref:FAD-binding oxidoreductase n=1 Tax=Biomaibacter acetigenes TaxID=2316383 RepID=A0A3G2R1A1_9FIRM|nr:FAD-dependent oxidoreductase [Biomaibacter acetigenes]AYO29222.1 FAD-binding oxidoreductase [Biomaibacter acetigenes]
MKSTDVVVIGGGVIGCSVAYHLAKRGIDVTIVERDDIASGTSGACDKAVLLQSKNPGLHLEMALESVKLFPQLQRDLDTDIEFKNNGGMIVIKTQEQWQVMQGFVERQKKVGLWVELLGREQALQRQPAFAQDIVGSTYSPMDGEVNPINLTLGFFRGAKKYGAKPLLSTEVRGIKVEKGRVSSVLTTGEEILTRFVVNACGVYAPVIGRMVGIDIPIIPRRGQIIVTEPVPPLIHGDVNCARYITAKFKPELLGNDENARLGIGLSLGQTENGNLLIGGTREFVGYDRRTTHRALRAILKHAVSLVPALKDISIIRSFAGLRPYTPDGLPILGEVENLKGFIMAAGHEGDGIALSAVTGKIISEIIADGRTSLNIDMGKLSLSRFKEEDIHGFRESHNCYGNAV